MIFVTLRFDDGTICQYDYAYKTMQKYGFPGSVFVIGSRIWSKYYISVEKLLEMQSNGWEIGYHSWSHNNRWIQDPSIYHKETECKSLIDQGLKISTFCFPHSAYNRSIITYLKKSPIYKTLVGIPSKDADSMRGPRPPNNMYHSFSINPFTKFSDIEKRLEQAIRDDEYLIFMLHKIAPVPTQSGQISLEKFEKVIKLLKKHQDAGALKVVTVKDAHRKLS